MVQTVKADMQKEVHKVEAEMSRRFDSQREDMQAMHLKLDLLIKSLTPVGTREAAVEPTGL